MTHMLKTIADILGAQLAMNRNEQLKALGGAFALNGNGHLKVGEVKAIDDHTISSDIVILDDSLAHRFHVNRHTGAMVQVHGQS